MTSEKQTAANRRNAEKSTGPRTPAGKAAIRFNALRHGLYARRTVLPGESQDRFEQLCDNLEAEWNPQSTTEQILVERLAVSYWTQVRLARGRQELFQESVPFAQKLALLDRLDQYDGRLQRSFDRTLKELRSLQKDRPAQAPAEADDDNAGKDLDYISGLAWIDEKGNQTVVSNPALRGPDGEYHDIDPAVLQAMIDKLDEDT